MHGAFADSEFFRRSSDGGAGAYDVICHLFGSFDNFKTHLPNSLQQVVHFMPKGRALFRVKSGLRGDGGAGKNSVFAALVLPEVVSFGVGDGADNAVFGDGNVAADVF